MTTQSGAWTAEAGGTSDPAAAWRAVRAADDIQYAPLPPRPVPQGPPDWLVAFEKWLGGVLRPVLDLLGQGWSAIELVLLVLAALAAIWIAWALLWPLWRDRRPRAPAADNETWAPGREAALALLEDADRLAGEGRYGEAAHLLLKRSVGQIAEVRPDWLSPSSTSREIGASTALPGRARSAFAVIAGEVERSLFALQGLALADWQRARAAYADFALADLRLPGAAEAP